MARKVWFITGASRGFGMELTKAALDAGDTVVATARNPKTIDDAFGKHDRLLTLRLDVTSEQQAKEAVDTALKRFGQIDVLVNNAGRELLGAVEEVTSKEVRAAFAVNVEGTLNVSRAALPSMRARKSGHILNLSAVGGFVSWPGWGIYCATAPQNLWSKASAKRCRANSNPSASDSPSLNPDPSDRLPRRLIA